MNDGAASNGQPLEDLDAVALAYASRSSVACESQRRRLRDELTMRCLPFAGRLARRYRGRGEPFEDLEQVARLGLIKAIDRYDPQRGSFTAYAVITISGEIKRHFRDVTWDIHVPRRLRDLSLEVGQATTVLTAVLARNPTVAEVAEHLNYPEESVVAAMESAAGYAAASLNAPVGGSDTVDEFGDLMGGADRGLESVDDRLTVSRLLLCLPARERRILALRFYGNLSQAEIAGELGISQMHVSRLLSRALSWLRAAIVGDVVPYWEGSDTAMDPHLVRATTSRTAGQVTVRVQGEVDRDVAERVRRRLQVALSTAATGERLVVDLSAVPLIDAAGIGVLIDAATAAAGAGVSFSLVGTRPYVAHILAVSGLTGRLGT